MSSINVSNLANGVFNVVKTVTANATFDTTIRAIIQERVDSATGKYKLQYQDSVFYAFTEDTKTIYAKGTEVFVLVPENDFTQEKRIIGSVKKLGISYSPTYQYEERYRKIGSEQLLKDSIEWKVTEQGSEEVSVDDNFIKYLQNDKTSGLWIEGIFTTSKSLEYQKDACYGLLLFLKLVNDTEIVLEFSSDDFEGNPFSQKYARQIAVWTGVDWKRVKQITKIESFAKGFITSVSPTPAITVENVKIYAVATRTDAELRAPRVELTTLQGLYVSSDTSISIQANLYIDSQVQSEWQHYWFKENPLVGQESKNYHAFGGSAWELLNTYIVDKDGNASIENLDQSSLQVWGTPPEDSALFGIAAQFKTEYIKCVMVNPENEGERYEAQVTVFNTDWENPYSILAGDNKNYVELITIPKDSKIDLKIKGALETDTIEWYRKSLSDSLFTLIVDQTEQTLVVSAADISTEATYCAVINGIQSLEVRVAIEVKQELYQLIIYNGNQIFQYDRNGRSPSHPAATFPVLPTNLSFALYDNVNNTVIPEKDLKEWTWSWEEASLIDYVGEAQVTENKFKGANPVSFRIKDAWVYETANNQITLTVPYKEQVLKAQTAFTFSKEGDPNSTYQDITVVIQKAEGESYNGLVYKGAELVSGASLKWRLITTEDADAEFQSFVPSVKEVSGPWVLVCQYSNNNKNYYGYYVQEPSLEDHIRLVGTPSQFVVYEANGLDPKYATWKFETQQEKDKWVAAEVQYKGPFSEETKASLEDIIPAAFSIITAERNGIIPIEIWLNGAQVGQIVLYAFLNPYVFSTLEAGGSTLKINNGESHILSQIALTGSREEDNTFTGLLIGMIGHTDANKSKQQGLFTFTKGVQTGFIDALTGNVDFGDPEKPILSIKEKSLFLTLGDTQYQCKAGSADAAGVIHLVLEPVQK